MSEEKTFRDFMNECKKFKLTKNPWNIEKSKKFRFLHWKYGNPFRLTGKGQKTVDSLLDQYWSGRKFSFKELMIVHELGFLKISLYGDEKLEKFNEQISIELEYRFNISLDLAKGKLHDYYFKRGFLEDNPDYVKNLNNILKAVSKIGEQKI